MQNLLFKINNLSFSISGKPILRELRFDILQGDYLAVIGPNGAGKTTLLKCLMGIYPCESGQIMFNNVPLADIKQKELARKVAYVPQNDGRPLPFTVKEFVMLARYPHLSPFTSYSSDDKSIVYEALENVGINRLQNRRLNTLSGGERQMVLIAAALAQQSQIILFDEPTAFLDPKYEAAIYGIMDKIHRSGKTIVTVTHDINGAILHSTKLIIIKQGKLVFEGKPQTITSGSILKEVYDKSFSFMKHPQSGKLIIVPGALV
jgi:iron complex transport system ATP-binding protein